MLGKGIPMTMSLNGKSRLESKLIDMDNILPQVIWMHYFLNKQRYEIKKNVINQDNKSAILLDLGKGPSSKRTKHIKVWYFLSTIRQKTKRCPLSISQRNNVGRCDYKAQTGAGIL